MQVYTGVKTTGIYCRLGCGARPNPGNTTKFSLAAAAEAAGYRACFQCRPYRYPLPVALDAPTLVCNVVRAILDGALDRESEEALAAHFDISVRHLRRIFSAHLGVTPDWLARSARAHFARVLLDDTDLPITQIAFAAGFGSVRQFNRVCREIFRDSPRNLRARRRKGDRLRAEDGLSLRLPSPAPVDWDEVSAGLEREAIPGVEAVRDGVYRRTILVEEVPSLLELSPGATDDHLVLCLHLSSWDELLHVARQARHLANLDVDPPGPSPGCWDPFEAAVCAIVGGGSSLAPRRRTLERLVERFGTPMPELEELGLRFLFPSPTLLATARLEDGGVPGARADAVRALARAVADGRLRLDPNGSAADTAKALGSVPGVGPRVSRYVTMRLGHGDVRVSSSQELGLAAAR